MEKTIKYPNGNAYEGAIDERKLPHGWGTMKYADGSVYVGRWSFGAWYGEGTFIDGRRVYVGIWVGTRKSEYVTLVENGEAMCGKMDKMGFLGPNGERLPEPVAEQSDDIPNEDKPAFNAHKITKNNTLPYVRLDGGTILFGTYPQTIKADNVTITDTVNDNGYFLGSDGEWYAKVVAKPRGKYYKFSNGATVEVRNTYYFRVEPIKWRIISENGGKAIIMCDSIIANHRFDEVSNNYAKSEIRKWLNVEFFDTAFDESQRKLILTTTVDNRCENTADNIFLLSYSEVEKGERAIKTASDYSLATGANMDIWWLRSPFDNYSFSVDTVNGKGYCNYLAFDGRVGSADRGIVPALQIQLN